MAAPSRFLVTELFKHRRPEFIRELAVKYGFTLRTGYGTKDSESWARVAEEGGFWIIRLDTMGHDTQWHFGIRPHYHKNWVESQAVLEKYLKKFVKIAAVYADDGNLIGLAGIKDSTHPDLKAKLQHILR